jgi:Protein of unknown function (DUF2917)
MDTSLMTQPQESDVQWNLSEGTALRLSAAPTPRVLAVTAGRVWLTSSSAAADPAPDVWLAAGESARVAPDDEVVLEAWPRARFTLLESPAASPRRLSSARAAAWARALRERLQWTPLPSWCA